ncbi:Gp138 family membrane-puncturing spike protein [Aureimonas ureilytica]|uniref:Gp138 family membrane-puncturing spike protein n=1 Tax=Aureimonas ureilytica TaxID=401562 RepID=UPI00035CE0BC|nr:Gp138 family membrane-puncturing spike protein [Aureimonas ureilytica]
MTGYIGKTTNRFEDTTGAAAQSEREDIFGEMPGRVVSFDPKTQMATIQPLARKRLNGVPTDLPELQEVPVRFHRAGGFIMTTPVKTGDLVSLRPMSGNMDNYHREGGAFDAADTRSFSLSDMEAFPVGGESLRDPIPNFNNKNMELRSSDGSFAMEMSEDGKFMQRGAQGNVYTIVAAALRNLANAQTIVSKGSSTGLYDHDQKAAVLALADKLDGMAL